MLGLVRIEVLDGMYSSSLSPHFTIPKRITPCSKTLIDNIFTNSADESSISGNLSYSISDQPVQFLIYPEFKTKNHQKQEKIYKRNYSKENLSNLKNEFQIIDWLNVLKANQNNWKISLGSLLKIINALLDKHTPKKLMTKKELKTRSKPCLTSSIFASIIKKNEIYAKTKKPKETTFSWKI